MSKKMLQESPESSDSSGSSPDESEGQLPERHEHPHGAQHEAREVSEGAARVPGTKPSRLSDREGTWTVNAVPYSLLTEQVVPERQRLVKVLEDAYHRLIKEFPDVIIGYLGGRFDTGKVSDGYICRIERSGTALEPSKVILAYGDYEVFDKLRSRKARPSGIGDLKLAAQRRSIFQMTRVPPEDAMLQLLFDSLGLSLPTDIVSWISDEYDVGLRRAENIVADVCGEFGRFANDFLEAMGLEVDDDAVKRYEHALEGVAARYMARQLDREYLDEIVYRTHLFISADTVPQVGHSDIDRKKGRMRRFFHRKRYSNTRKQIQHINLKRETAYVMADQDEPASQLEFVADYVISQMSNAPEMFPVVLMNTFEEAKQHEKRFSDENYMTAIVPISTAPLVLSKR